MRRALELPSLPAWSHTNPGAAHSSSFSPSGATAPHLWLPRSFPAHAPLHPLRRRLRPRCPHRPIATLPAETPRGPTHHLPLPLHLAARRARIKRPPPPPRSSRTNATDRPPPRSTHPVIALPPTRRHLRSLHRHSIRRPARPAALRYVRSRPSRCEI